MATPDKRPSRSEPAALDATTAPARDGSGPPDTGSGSGSSDRGRKVWLKPRIHTGHLFESNSLACGKNTPELDQCNQNPTNS